MDAKQLRQELVELLPRLRRYAYALTGNKSNADDLLQNCIERLLDKGVRPGIDLDKWAFRVCRNAWVDECRSRRVRATTSLEQDAMSDCSQIDGDRPITTNIQLAQVQKAMQLLPGEQREALALVALEGYSYAEAAQTLSVPIGTIMSRIARARSRLCNALGLGGS